jgi:hypothetical protein
VEYCHNVVIWRIGAWKLAGEGGNLAWSLKPEPYTLPYVLNGPIYLFLFEIFSTSAEVDILHNIGVLQD